MSEAETLQETADALDVEPGELESILADVEAVLEDLASVDVDLDDPGDLARVTDLLPTEPHRAEIVQAALPRPLAESIHYVHPSDRQDGYWRRTPDLRDPANLSDAQLVHRYQFAKAAQDVGTVRGTKRTEDGRRIPRNAEEIGRQTAGSVEVAAEPDRDKGLDLVRRIRKWI